MANPPGVFTVGSFVQCHPQGIPCIWFPVQQVQMMVVNPVQCCFVAAPLAVSQGVAPVPQEATTIAPMKSEVGSQVAVNKDLEPDSEPGTANESFYQLFETCRSRSVLDENCLLNLCDRIPIGTKAHFQDINVNIKDFGKFLGSYLKTRASVNITGLSLDSSSGVPTVECCLSSTSLSPCSKISVPFVGFEGHTKWRIKCTIADDSTVSISFDFDSVVPMDNIAAVASCTEQLSNTTTGSRLVQMALVLLNPRNSSFGASGEMMRKSIVHFIQKHLWEVGSSLTGNYILQIFVQQTPVSELDFLLDFIQANLVDCSEHRTFGRIVQRVLEKNLPAPTTSSFIDAIAANTRQLIFHQYGNYVFQTAVKVGTPRHREQLWISISEVGAKQIAAHKFGNNVLINFIKSADFDALKKVWEALHGSGLERHVYGSFVMRILKRSLRDRSAS